MRFDWRGEAFLIEKKNPKNAVCYFCRSLYTLAGVAHGPMIFLDK